MTTWIETLLYVCPIIAASLWFLREYARHKLSYWSRRGVKSPPTHLLFGNFKDIILLRKAPVQVMQDIYNAADPEDPYIGFYIFHKPMLLLREPRIMKQVMVKDFEVFPNRRFGEWRETDSVGLTSLLSVKQPRWKYIRGKVTPSLTGQKLKNMVPLIIDPWRPMFEYLDTLPEGEAGGKKVELKDLSSRYVNDVVSSLIFGITTNSFDRNDRTLWGAGQDIFTGALSGIVFTILFFVPSLGYIAKLFTAKRPAFFRQIFWDSFRAREEQGNKRGDLIDSLIPLKNGEQNPDYKFEGDNLLAQATSFYVAAYEAVSTAVSFALFELARHPEYQSKLYEEIKCNVADGEWTLERINNMHFLSQVIDETLRMYPPLPIIDRIALRDYRVQETGLIIEKNVPVYVSASGTNNDPKNYECPEEFRPLRQKVNSELQENLAFGIGPRSCIGQRLGQVITKAAIIGIVSNYELSYRSQAKGSFSSITIFTNAANGIRVHVKKRSEREE